MTKFPILAKKWLFLYVKISDWCYFSLLLECCFQVFNLHVYSVVTLLIPIPLAVPPCVPLCAAFVPCAESRHKKRRSTLAQY